MRPLVSALPSLRQYRGEVKLLGSPIGINLPIGELIRRDNAHFARALFGFKYSAGYVPKPRRSLWNFVLPEQRRKVLWPHHQERQ